MCKIFRVHSKYHGAVRPHTCMFPVALERDFALFLKHCELLRVPRTKSDLKRDIQHYVKYYNLQFKKLTEDGPGEFKYYMLLKLH